MQAEDVRDVGIRVEVVVHAVSMILCAINGNL